MSAVAVEIRPPLWRRLLGFNALTAIVLGVLSQAIALYGAFQHMRGRPVRLAQSSQQIGRGLTQVGRGLFGVAGRFGVLDQRRRDHYR